MGEKKVIAVIVEGPSDEIALGGIMKEYFASDEVQFAVVHGDITSDYTTSVTNVVSKAGVLVKGIQSRYGYRRSDFFKVIHIADTDGAFTKDCIEETGVDKIQYYEDHIECSDRERVEERNQHKAEILCKLYSTGSVLGIPYRLYYNSCNLEHVLYDQLKNFSNEEKEDLSYDFAEKYEGKVQEFIEVISDEAVAVQGTYRETWKYIEREKHSLERNSNMHLIFEQ